jgi:hypothetical protein
MALSALIVRSYFFPSRSHAKTYKTATTTKIPVEAIKITSSIVSSPIRSSALTPLLAPEDVTGINPTGKRARG